MNDVAAVLLTKDDADVLGPALKSVEWCDQIIAVDSDSTDGTREIVRHHGGNVVDAPPVKDDEGFDHLRKYGVRAADTEWILLLDSDERVKPSLREAVVTHLGESVDALFAPRQNFYKDHWVRCSHWWPDYQPLVVRKRYLSLSSTIHDWFTIDDAASSMYLEPTIENAVTHLCWTSHVDNIEKMVRYARIEGRQKRPTVRETLWSVVKNVYTIFVRGEGWRDGRYGMILTVSTVAYWLLAGFYSFTVRYENHKL